MSEPTIRQATLDDVDALSRLRWQLYTEYQPEIDEPFDAYRERFEGFAHRALANDDWRAWVAEDADGIVGNVWLQTVPRVPAPGRQDPSPIGYLTNLYVSPGHRARGVGRHLVDAILDHCQVDGYDLVLTFPADEAYGFYERAGFIRPPDPMVHQLERPRS